jgi:hypothetical protein
MPSQRALEIAGKITYEGGNVDSFEEWRSLPPRMLKEWPALQESVAEIIDSQVAAALRLASEHTPMVAFVRRYAWIYCSCGFNKEYESHTDEPSTWRDHILALIPDPSALPAQHWNDGTIAKIVKWLHILIRTAENSPDDGDEGTCPDCIESVKNGLLPLIKFTPSALDRRKL